MCGSARRGTPSCACVRCPRVPQYVTAVFWARRRIAHPQSGAPTDFRLDRAHRAWPRGSARIPVLRRAASPRQPPSARRRRRTRERGRFEDRALLPAYGSERLEVGVLEEARRFCELLRVREEFPRLRIEVVLRPGSRELWAEVVVAGEAAHGRRVHPQSRGAANQTVDHGRDHLTLEPCEG